MNFLIIPACSIGAVMGKKSWDHTTSISEEYCPHGYGNIIAVILQNLISMDDKPNTVKLRYAGNTKLQTTTSHYNQVQSQNL